MSLLKKIETDIIPKEKINIFSLGQSGYIVKTNNSIIYIDPYLTDFIQNSDGLNEKDMSRLFHPPINPKEINKIDAVLCTHSHADHMDPWTLNYINQDYKLICTENAYRNNLFEIKIKNKLFIDLNDVITIKDFRITVLPAAHYKLSGLDGNPDCISFIIEAFGKKLFFWGDGIIYEGLIDELNNHKFDLFFAPINGRDWFREKKGIIGNLSSRELVELCNEINLDLVIPNHFDLFKYNSEFVEHFYNYIHKFNPSQSFKILKPGDSLTI